MITHSTRRQAAMCPGHTSLAILGCAQLGNRTCKLISRHNAHNRAYAGYNANRYANSRSDANRCTNSSCNTHAYSNDDSCAYSDRFETNIDRYFPVGTPVSTMISEASKLSQQQVKVLIEQQVQEYWGVIHSTFGFSTLEKAYAFFLGQATRESTLQGGLETGGSTLGSGTSGSGIIPGHSYGPLQAAETAYANTNSGYRPRPMCLRSTSTIWSCQFLRYRHFNSHGHSAPDTFCSPGLSSGRFGVNIVRYALAGYNTGWVTNSGVLTSYSDEIGALAGWYLNNNHLYDTAWTWTGDPRVDRSNPWGWYP